MDRFRVEDARSLGLRCSPLIEEIEKAACDEAFAQAFADVMLAEFFLEGPDHNIPSLDPNFIPIAHVGNGDYYGFYVYPPAQKGRNWEDPIVEHLHEVPSVEFCSPTVADWLRDRLAADDESCLGDDPPQSKLLLERMLRIPARTSPSSGKFWRALLPTETRVQALKGELERWLETSQPDTANDLLAYERTWVTWWTSTDYEQHTLIDYGIELYGRLGWTLPLRTLESQLLDQPLTPRSDRLAALWARNHKPSKADVDGILADLVEGDRRAAIIFDEWTDLYRFDLAVHSTEEAVERSLLGNGLAHLCMQATEPHRQDAALDALVQLEFDEALDVLSDSVRAAFGDQTRALEEARSQHERDRREMDNANDWSDVMD